MARPLKEYHSFRDLTDRLLSVPKAVVDKRIADYKERMNRIPRDKRRGRNPKASPSDREGAE